MGMAVKVKMLLVANGMTIQDLAERLEPKTTAQNVGAKLKRDNLSERDLQQIAKICGVAFEGCFVFDDGRRI